MNDMEVARRQLYTAELLEASGVINRSRQDADILAKRFGYEQAHGGRGERVHGS